MAIWVNVNRAAKFPEVNRVNKRAGWGQGAQGQQTAGGTGQTSGNPISAPRGFLETVRAFVTGTNGAVPVALPAWIRKSPLGTNDWQDAQVDVTAIPGVRPLNTNGKWRSFVA
jgi:hypothetical protein